MNNASAIILAGGKNSRMGKNKALIQLPTGETILQNITNILQRLFSEIILVANRKESYMKIPPFLKGDKGGLKSHEKLNVHLVEDLIKDCGPLGGIFTGLCYSTAQYNFVVACDMPFIQPDLIRLLLKESETYDVVIPEIDGELEPLFAVYCKNCIPIIFENLQKRNLIMHEALTKLRVKKIKRSKIDPLDPNHLSFFNINTVEDLKRAKSLMKKKSHIYQPRPKGWLTNKLPR